MRLLEEWLQDIRFASRQCRRAPGFVTATALTLALGIGATTAIFTVVNGVLLRALPYPAPDRIVQLWELNASQGEMQFTDPNFDDVRASTRSFSAVAEFGGPMSISVAGDITPTRAQMTEVSHDFFDAIGVRPLIGRTFVPEEERTGGVPSAVVSWGFWQRVFGGNESALGKRLIIGDVTYTVVGVMRPELNFPAATDLWLSRELEGRLPSRNAHNWQVVARLRPSVTVASARQEVGALARALAARYGTETVTVDMAVIPLRDQLVGASRPTLLVLLAAALVLLAIACTNAANLMVARLTARRGELAVRLAMGAGASRLTRQCLAESALIALAGGVIGSVVAVIGTRALLALDPDRLPRSGDVRVDGVVLGFALVVSIATAVALALVSAWRATRGDLRETLSASERNMSGAGSSVNTRRVLVIAQVSMTLVLLVAAGLLGRSFLRLMSVDPGFRTERAVVVDLSVTADDSLAERRRVNFYHDLLTRYANMPGVTAVGAINVIPLAVSFGASGTFVELSSPNEPVTMDNLMTLFQDETRTGTANFRVASGGYFAAMRIPLIEGRTFDDRDGPDAPHVALVSASFAAHRWPGKSAIGKTIEMGNMDGDLRPFTIIGVVGDVREGSLESSPKPTLYANYIQRPRPAIQVNIVLAGQADAKQAAAIVRELRPDVPPRVRTIESIVSSSVAGRRFLLVLVGVFGGAALLLAALGLYSVIAYLVAQRARELSIRLALGAQSNDIIRLVLRQGTTLALVGIAAGAVIAFSTTRLLSGLLYGVGAFDPVAFGGVALLVAVVALLSCWLPAYRASRIDVRSLLK